MPSLPQLNPLRLRSYVFRLPLTTRLLVAAMVGLWAAAIPFPWLRDVSVLAPDKFDLTQSRCFSSCELHGEVGREEAEVGSGPGLIRDDGGS